MKEFGHEVDLTTVCDTITYGYTASATDEDTGVKFLRITDIVPDRINWETVPFCLINEKDVEKYQLNIGDIVVARTGATTGWNKTIKHLNHKAVYASFLIKYSVDRSIADPNYVGYNLQSSNWYDYVEAIAGGSAQPGANAKQLGSFKFLLPSLSEQKAITSVLSSLDDKIDLLHRQNKTLEAMAETLFRQWFIEEAKEDWEEKTIGDIFTIKGGGTPSTKEPSYWDGSIAWTSPRDLSTAKSLYMFSTERTITELGLTKVSSGLLPVGTLLMSSRAPIGYLALTDIEVAVNQGYIAILKHDLYSNEFMYLWCKANMELIKNSGNGSVFQEISKASFRELPFVCPPEPLLKRFNGYCINWFSKIKLNAKQIQTLENLRDTLLPRLMSGEVRVQYQTEDVA
ncbi:restriction endonuclease subunit S [Acinetobacter baumannii]|uniref:restriction endonuclease subunit S n=1 Tax=Acinetobacter baumannii TaxID=470 RepID=UPI001F1BF79D|nr:restriction endonuclease subunit S [Acinetobacter baumannii]MCF1298457.1 restriction endonuclease subunit S [Acinetobacter baumannii]HAV4522964.1 restriction endonuclease subunit S [Acinetobacter baumannii]HAV4564215.1 restriction endonuclease subunit S [Acinetobacter baumannii]